MRTTVFICFFLISSVAWAQNPKHDSLRYIMHTDQFGVQKKTQVVYPSEILIIDGDSIYTILNENQLQKTLESRGGGG